MIQRLMTAASIVALAAPDTFMPAAAKAEMQAADWYKEFTDIPGLTRWQCHYKFDEQAQIKRCESAFDAKSCHFSDDSFFIKDYPVEGERSVTFFVRKKTDQGCGDSQLRLLCIAGSCQAYPSTGEYGFYPGETSAVAIDGKKWKWVGDHPDWIGHQMWKAVRDGSRFAYELSHWPGYYPTGSEVLIVPKGLKDRMYRLSLTKP